MSMIKKVLANVTQLFTDAEKAKARDNIGVPLTANQGPPPSGIGYSAGTFVSMRGEDGMYYLLEDWHSGTDFAAVKKIEIAPAPDVQFWTIRLDQMDVGSTVSGLYVLIQTLARITPPAIKLVAANDSYAIMHLMDSDKGHQSGNVYEYSFSYLTEVGNPSTELRFTVLTVNINDYVAARQFSVACTEI